MSRDFSEICPSCGYQCMTVEQCHRAQQQNEKQTRQPVESSELEVFEKWAVTQGYDLAIGRCYEDDRAYHAYEGWKARGRQPNQEAQQSDELFLDKVHVAVALLNNARHADNASRRFVPDTTNAAIDAALKAVKMPDSYFFFSEELSAERESRQPPPEATCTACKIGVLGNHTCPVDATECKTEFEAWYKRFGDGDAIGFKLKIKEIAEVAWRAAWGIWSTERESVEVRCNSCGNPVQDLLPNRREVDYQLIRNLSMLVIRLAHRLNLREDGKALASQALEFLQRHNLQGSPLREEEQGRRG
jgi:hypothetical protein